MKRLIEKSISNCNSRWNSKLGDTSQNGNWSCFRNEYHPDNPDRKIHPKYFCPIPKRSRVEFDFINIDRPDREICKALSDDVVIDVSYCLILCICCVYHDDNNYDNVYGNDDENYAILIMMMMIMMIIMLISLLSLIM